MYQEVPGVDAYDSRAEYGAAVAGTRFTCEKLKYSSGGLPVIAYLYRSAGSAGRPKPLVIFNRGGYVVQDRAPLLAAGGSPI